MEDKKREMRKGTKAFNQGLIKKRETEHYHGNSQKENQLQFTS